VSDTEAETGQTETDYRPATVGDAVMSSLLPKYYPSIKPAHGGEIRPIKDSNRGRELAERRWNKSRKWAEAGMVIGVLGPDADLTEANKCMSYVLLNAVQAKIAYDISDPRSPQAYRNVRQAIGADVGAPAKQGANDAPVSQVLIIVSDAVAARMLDKYGGGA
jgi:hypothetical protein